MQDPDRIIRFVFEKMAIRGQWLKLSTSWRSVIANHNYSAPVQQQLGQAIVASTLLAATIKFKGLLVLQAQGQGPLTAVIAQSTNDYYIRGLARNSASVGTGTLTELYGKGRLVITIEPDNNRPYQGIVELDGENLAQALENYYAQSEQIKTRFWLFANGQQAAGLLLQELPGEQDSEDDWKRIEMLANTVTEQEILELSYQKMLYRLFNEESIRVFEPEPVQYRCRCSIAKIEQTLISLGHETLHELLQERDEVTVDCEFCNQQYSFDAVDINKLVVESNVIDGSNTQH